MCHVRAGKQPLEAPPLPLKGPDSNVCAQCRVGHDQLVGEVIRIEGDKATIQVYEETGTTLDHLQ